MAGHVDLRALDHQKESFVVVGRQQFESLACGLREIVAAFGGCGQVAFGHGGKHGKPAERIDLRGFERNAIALGPERIDACAALGERVAQRLAAAAEEQVDVASDHVAGDRVGLAAVGDMGVESGRRGMVEVAGDHQAGAHALFAGADGQRYERLPGGVEAQRCVAGLAARAQRRAGGGRVGDSVVGRAGGDQGNVVGAVESRGPVLFGDLQEGDLREAHAVADQVDDVAYFGFAVGAGGAQGECACGQCEKAFFHGWDDVLKTKIVHVKSIRNYPVEICNPLFMNGTGCCAFFAGMFGFEFLQDAAACTGRCGICERGAGERLLDGAALSCSVRRAAVSERQTGGSRRG